MQANVKQEEVLGDNQWTKTLETLLGIDQQELKESISIATDESHGLARELNTTKLEKCGRMVGKSVMPE
jgi:hypothetical protein